MSDSVDSLKPQVIDTDTYSSLLKPSLIDWTNFMGLRIISEIAW